MYSILLFKNLFLTMESLNENNSVLYHFVNLSSYFNKI